MECATALQRTPSQSGCPFRRGTPPEATGLRTILPASGHYVHGLWRQPIDRANHTDRPFATHHHGAGMGSAGSGTKTTHSGAEYVPARRLFRWAGAERRAGTAIADLRIETLPS